MKKKSIHISFYDNRHLKDPFAITPHIFLDFHASGKEFVERGWTIDKKLMENADKWFVCLGIGWGFWSINLLYRVTYPEYPKPPYSKNPKFFIFIHGPLRHRGKLNKSLVS